MAITLWGRATSANVQKVRWALAELGLDYEHIPLGGRFGGNRTPDYLAMNPNGLVPTLRDGSLVLWESHAIVRYLTAQYGAGELWPIDPRARAESDRWTDWTATTFQPAWIEVFWGFYRTPPAERDLGRLAERIGSTERCFSILDRQLGRTRFLAGDRLTYADIVAGVAMFRWTTMGIESALQPNVQRWHEALRGRPGYREAVEVDYSELAGRLSH
ncbi:MAG TPA: glutathione S-transferase family protein [Devosia sp.]|nr:glutathione S-transferase family protein [Devosia sp.]